MNTKPYLRGHFHQAMFFVALGACVPLILKSNSAIEYIAMLVYTFGILSMFGVSSIYHRITWNPEQRAFMKKLDHAAIYLMIAGTCTPIALLALKDQSQKVFLITIWIITFAGIIQSLFFVNLPKIASAILYLIAGYVVTPYIGEINSAIGSFNVGLIVAGGVIYSLGAICYGFKWPKLKPHMFGYHELFHVFVSIAAIFHFFVINSLL